jgi:hypothetical protein
VNRAARILEARGWTIVGREITVRTGSQRRLRIDIVAERNGKRVLIEVKYNTSTLSPNQRAGFRELREGGGTFVGGNARRAGLPEAFGPARVRTFTVPKNRGRGGRPPSRSGHPGL